MICCVQRSISAVFNISLVYQCTPSVARITVSVTLRVSPLLPRRISPSNSLFMLPLTVTLRLAFFFHYLLLYICVLLVAEHFPSNSSFSLTLIVVICDIVKVFSFFIIINGFLSRSFFCVCYEPPQINP